MLSRAWGIGPRPFPSIIRSGCVALAGSALGSRRCGGIDLHLGLANRGEVKFENFPGDDAGAIEGVLEPEVRGQGMVGDGGDDSIFKRVARFKAEDADGFYADILVGRIVNDGGVGIVGDGAGKDVGGAAAGVGDAYLGYFDGFEGTVEVKIEAGELTDAQFIVDVHAGVDF